MQTVAARCCRNRSAQWAVPVRTSVRDRHVRSVRAAREGAPAATVDSNVRLALCAAGSAWRDSRRGQEEAAVVDRGDQQRNAARVRCRWFSLRAECPMESCLFVRVHAGTGVQFNGWVVIRDVERSTSDEVSEPDAKRFPAGIEPLGASSGTFEFLFVVATTRPRGVGACEATRADGCEAGRERADQGSPVPSFQGGDQNEAEVSATSSTETRFPRCQYTSSSRRVRANSSRTRDAPTPIMTPVRANRPRDQSCDDERDDECEKAKDNGSLPTSTMCSFHHEADTGTRGRDRRLLGRLATHAVRRLRSTQRPGTPADATTCRR